MKKLLIILFLLPAMALAQEEHTAQPSSLRNEIGLSTGIAPSFFNRYSGSELWLSTRLTYLHNIKNVQIGMVVEAGESEWDYGSITSSFVLNYVHPIRKSYFYAGGSIGFYYSDNISKWRWVDRYERGYSLQFHSGLSMYITRHLSLFSEVGVRTTQVWFRNYRLLPVYPAPNGPDVYELFQYTDNRFFVSTPATLGLRYRF